MARKRAASRSARYARFRRLAELGGKLDLAAHLARRLEPHFRGWWVPAISLLLPLLLILFALLFQLGRG